MGTSDYFEKDWKSNSVLVKETSEKFVLHISESDGSNSFDKVLLKTGLEVLYSVVYNPLRRYMLITRFI